MKIPDYWCKGLPVGRAAFTPEVALNMEVTLLLGSPQEKGESFGRKKSPFLIVSKRQLRKLGLMPV
jgi:hypothetical protein